MLFYPAVAEYHAVSAMLFLSADRKDLGDIAVSLASVCLLVDAFFFAP